MRSLPWVRGLQEGYAEQGLRVIGVHAPEFDYEKDPARVREAVREHGLTYPILLDPDHAYWRRLGNRYWPTLYVVDREGRIRLVHVGETRAGTERARRVEAQIEELLAEGS